MRRPSSLIAAMATMATIALSIAAAAVQLDHDPAPVFVPVAAQPSGSPTLPAHEGSLGTRDVQPQAADRPLLVAPRHPPDLCAGKCV